jgi:hypothetical protein
VGVPSEFVAELAFVGAEFFTLVVVEMCPTERKVQVHQFDVAVFPSPIALCAFVFVAFSARHLQVSWDCGAACGAGV